ncbi:MAG TPA: hypothetical protein VFP40_04515 [Terriglobales bacterium]|nr:hypothetical protein [Terriglobales bacterium]
MSKHNHSHHRDEGMELHFEQVSHHGVRYENRDLGGRGIFAFLVGLIVFGVVICLVVYGYFAISEHYKSAAEPLSATVTPSQEPRVPDALEQYRQVHKPAVMLQNDDVADMNNFLSQQNQALSSYGWVDQKAGVVHIPIDQAMKNIVQQGLPARPQPQLPPTADFGSGASTVAGAAGGTRPETRE